MCNETPREWENNFNVYEYIILIGYYIIYGGYDVILFSIYVMMMQYMQNHNNILTACQLLLQSVKRHRRGIWLQWYWHTKECK